MLETDMVMLIMMILEKEMYAMVVVGGGEW